MTGPHMAKLADPFRPTTLADPASYVGRQEEIFRVLRILYDLEQNCGTNFLIMGERGLGKSSLLKFTAALCSPARRKKLLALPHYKRIFDNFYDKFHIKFNDGQLNFETMVISIDDATDDSRFFQKLTNANDEFKKRVKSYFESAKDFLSDLPNREIGVGPGGVKLGAKTSANSVAILIDRFATIFVETARDLQKKKESGKYDGPTGIILLIDEADTANVEILNIGTILKAFSEIFQHAGCGNIAIGLAGLPAIRSNILSTHISAWRAFETIELERLKPEELEPLAKSCLDEAIVLDAGYTDAVPKLLAAASEGYPHWLRQYGSSTLKKFSEEREKKTEPLKLEERHVEAARVEAARKIGDSYYRADFDRLPEEARLVLIKLAAGYADGMTLSQLSELMHLEQKQLDAIKHQLLEGHYVGSSGNDEFVETITITSPAFRRWLQIEFHNTLFPPNWPDVAPALSYFDGDIKIAGENIPIFEDHFRRMVKTVSDNSAHGKIATPSYDAGDLFRLVCHDLLLRNLTVKDSLQKLVESLPKEWNVRDLLLKMIESTKDTSAAIADTWSNDILAIPHYLLGYAVDRGIYDLGELLSSLPEFEKCRPFLEHSIIGFRETCTYDGRWYAVPFSIIARMLFHRSPKARDALKSASESDGEVLRENPILTESEDCSISLWYEWQHVLAAVNGRTALRGRGEDEPWPSHALRELANGEVSPESPIAKGIRTYALILDAQEKSDIGKYNFRTAGAYFEANKKYAGYIGWTDWAATIFRSDAGKHFGCDLLSLNGTIKQPVEGWVFVLPRRGNVLKRQGGAKHVDALIRLLLGTLHYAWQKDFQAQAGCSPVRSTLLLPETATLQPWTQSILRSMDENLPKGKRPLEPLRMLAEIMWLSAILFERDNSGKVVGACNSGEQLKDRLITATRPFFGAIGEIRDYERQYY